MFLGVKRQYFYFVRILFVVRLVGVICVLCVYVYVCVGQFVTDVCIPMAFFVQNFSMTTATSTVVHESMLI